MSLLGLIGLIFLLYTFYIIGRVLYTGYSFMRAMGIKPKFTRKGPKFETDFGGSQRTTQQQSHNTGSSGNAHHEGGSTNNTEPRNGKMFSKDEGEYIDFEEIK